MSIQKKEYELSVWKETLGENGQKVEKKDYIIGAHDMTYLGRATDIVFVTNLNGTHTLTFQMPDRYFDSEKDDFVRNEFIDNLFNERKLKLKYKGEWYEFYIKTVSEQKQFKSYMKKYTCTDAFIDELSRNGYGITFDEELYNNVEEIGEFSREILEDSIWDYAPEYNWGDFTEYLEEKLFRIPVSLFSKLEGYKLTYKIPGGEDKIINAFTGKKRQLEMGDDLAASVNGKGGYFWDMKGNNSLSLLTQEKIDIENDGYIYVPYSQMQFCYKTTSTDAAFAATEEVQYYQDSNGKALSYAIAPKTIDPNALIQFIAIPKGAEVEIDEAGLLLNKDYTYVMTVDDWNNTINSNWFYKFETSPQDKKKNFFQITSADFNLRAVGNFAAYYEGYLDRINDIEVINGKKISITDRTEINISDEIDQYVTVYNNDHREFLKDGRNYYINPDGNWVEIYGYDPDYTVCSKIETREVVPQLARNLVQNGYNIKSTDGWEPMRLYDGEYSTRSTSINLKVGGLNKDTSIETYDPSIEGKKLDFSYLEVNPVTCTYYTEEEQPDPEDPDKTITVTVEHTQSPYDLDPEAFKFDVYNSIINFGIVGQEKEIEANKIYCLGISLAAADGVSIEDLNNIEIRIGEGKVLTQGEYDIGNDADPFSVTTISVSQIAQSGTSKLVTAAEIEGFIFIQFARNIKNPYIAITNAYHVNEETQEKTYFSFNLYGCWFFEAYTKGIDQFANADYRYSGRELFSNIFKLPDETEEHWEERRKTAPYFITSQLQYSEISRQIIFEEDIMPGDTYEFNKYFIQQVIAVQSDRSDIADSCGAKSYLNENGKIIETYTDYKNVTLPYSSAQFNEKDIKVSTKYIDLNLCQFYDQTAKVDEPDCTFNGERICLYQKYGYCPYLFQTEKHCRKIRTLKGEKSNRFNLTQELSKVFEVYPIYWTGHYDNGKIKTETITNTEIINDIPVTTSYERMKKKMFYITEKGNENKLGFRYEKNLSNISRDIKSDQIVTKLYVQDVDSEISKTGLSSIKTAEDNPSKDSFIINFDYYTTKGILDKAAVDADLYGKDENDMGYLKQLGYLNSEYDKLSNLIINLQDASFNELEANVKVNTEAIETAQKQLAKYKKELDKYKATAQEKNNKTYQSYVTKYNEQLYILTNLIVETFYTCDNGQWVGRDITTQPPEGIRIPLFDESGNTAVTFFDVMSLQQMQESKWYKDYAYDLGMLGQYNKEYLQICEWKRQQAAYLKEINKLSLAFFRKYEPYLKEGTWSDSNYISDNAYYFGACEVAAEGAIPNVSYNISVVDLYALPEYEDYKFDIADTTYVEDIGMFGINPITGLPNRLKVLISGITENLDEPMKNTIKVQNYTTQFEDLFQQVTATVQSLTFNENIYKRASNFTSNQNIKQESLQGALNTNEQVLLNTDETNITLDKTGQAGSDINNHNNKYRLDGQGLFFSNNGGQTWNVGVGPGGINADYINVGTLDAGKIRIVDNEYLYFLWDKNGITAFRDPMSKTDNVTFSDYAQFNRYGLSLVENGKIRLRSGYAFNGVTLQNATTPEMELEAGNADTEKTMGDKVGFYLYNDKGATIFATETASLDSTSPDQDADLTARLSLVGEMYVTDKIKTPGQLINSYHYSDCIKIESHNILTLTEEIEEPAGTSTLTLNYTGTLNQHMNEIKDAIAYWAAKGNITQGSQVTINITEAPQVTTQYIASILTVNVISAEKTEYVDSTDNNYYYIVSSNYFDYAGARFNLSQDGNLIETITIYQHCVIKDGDKIYSYTFNNYRIGHTDSRTINKDSAHRLEQVTTGQFYFIEGSSPWSASSLSLFKESDTYYYENERKDEIPSPDDDGAIGLYINNKVAWKQDAADIGEQRIFCCSKKTNLGDSNIFTIKKNGNLYMGGTIKPYGDRVAIGGEICDYVEIENAYLSIENSQWKMDFDNIYDSETGENLVDYIAKKVSDKKLIRHNHEIKTIKGVLNELPDSTFIYMPTANDISKVWDGIHFSTVFNMMMSTNPYQLLDLFITGSTSYIYDSTHTLILTFSQKVPILGGLYQIDCENTNTENAGDSSESSGEGGGTFNNWGFLDPIQ